MAGAMLTMVAVPGHCFIDYLFGGSATTDSIGNNVVGDLRAWWTGNPVYNFNPYYSGGNQPGQPNAPTQPGQNMNSLQNAPQYYPPQNQQPSVTYYPPQGQQYGYAQGQGQPPMQQQYPPAPQGYQTQPAPPPQAYYQGPGPQQQQAYQGPQQQQAYQGPQQQQAYQGPQQGYEQTPQGDYQGQPDGRYQTYQYEQETPQE